MFSHLSANKKKYLTLLVGILLAGAAQQGYVPQPVVDLLKAWLGF